MRYSKRRAYSDDRPMAEINVTPLVDVMLVLLIIFMVTTPLLTQGIEVDLPAADTEPMSTPAEPVTLLIDANGRYFLDIGTGRDKSLDDDEVVRRIRAVIRNKPEQMIVVKGDRRVPYGRVAYGMGLLQEAGATRIGFVTEPGDRKEAALP